MTDVAGRRTYYDGLNRHLLQAVPDHCLRILEVGCANGNLGARLKEGRPDRTVYGIELDPAAASAARRRLDAVFEIDVEAEMPPIDLASLDCIIYGDVLEHLIEPWQVLRRHRALTAPSGIVLCSIPNIQHHSVLKQIMRGDFQYRKKGLLDETHLRFFTFATVFKMLLDASFEPLLIDTIDIGGGDALIESAAPLVTEVRGDMGRVRRFMNAQQLIVRGRPLPIIDDRAVEMPVTIVACVNDEDQLNSNLLSSPDLGDDSPHELLLYRGCESAAEGLNEGISQARNELVVLVHQDVYLPHGWIHRLHEQWRLAEASGPVGVAGVFGSRQVPTFVESRQDSDARGLVGRVVDRDHLHSTTDHDDFPCPVDYLDELVLVVPRSTPLSLDASLGWHLYGTDLCLQAQRQGLGTFVLDALCMHNTLTSSAPPSDYQRSAGVIATKWSEHLPIHTVATTIYGSPERRQLERVEAERREAITERQRAEAEREEALIQLESARAALDIERSRLARTAEALTLVEQSRTWRARQKLKGLLGRLGASRG
jgi:SAM-dependent methyltransferase